jgi:hypothetical protein
VGTDAASIRRFAGIALVTGLSVAAAAAVLALLTGSFDDTDTRVILTSIGFALCSAVGSTGAAARLRPGETLQLLGTATLGAAMLTFVLLLAGIWTNMDDWGSEGIWRTFGCVGILGIAGAHGCALLGARRSADTDLVRLLTASAIALAALDTFVVILPLAGAVDHVDDGVTRLFGATLVLLVLTSVLPPILRRMQPATPQPAAPQPAAPQPAESNGNNDPGDEFLASAVIRIADKIDVLNGDPGNRAPEIRAEVERLRKLAQSFENQAE